MTQNINAKINIALNTFEPKIGAKAPDFTAPNPEGEMITLSKILGKVTILDFWASWCRPCRIENPNFVKIYDQYHAKGLEIISVSLDRNNQKQRWVEAIEKDQLNWYNVSNLKFWQDPLAQLYNVSSIPATFILDEKGIVLATKLRGAELKTKIAELLEN
jgi:peroxiredoxin